MSGKILIVDDDGTTIRLLERRLESHSYEVISAANGQEALAKAKSEMPGLIISDVVMPEMDGFSFYKAIKADEDTMKIPIIILSARGKMEDTFRAFEVDEFFTKPIDMEELLEVVKRRIGTFAKPKSPTIKTDSAADEAAPDTEDVNTTDEEEESVKTTDQPQKPEKPKEEAESKDVPDVKEVKQNVKPTIRTIKDEDKDEGRGRIIVAGASKMVNGLCVQLRNKKYVVKTVESDGDLVNMIKEFPPDMAIIDVFLGSAKADGAVRAIRKERKLKKIPVILFDCFDKNAVIDGSMTQVKTDIQAAKTACLEAGATQATGFYDEENLLAAVKLCLGY